MGASQPDTLPDQVREQQPRLHLGNLLVAVDRELDPAHRDLLRRLVAAVLVDHRHCQAALSVAVALSPGRARLRMRCTNVATMCRLYSALPRWSVRGRAASAARLAAASMLSAVSALPVK